MLKEIKEQLAQVQTDINEKIGNKTNEKGMNSLRSLCVSRPTYQIFIQLSEYISCYHNYHMSFLIL